MKNLSLAFILLSLLGCNGFSQERNKKVMVKKVIKTEEEWKKTLSPEQY